MDIRVHRSVSICRGATIHRFSNELIVFENKVIFFRDQFNFNFSKIFYLCLLTVDSLIPG